MKEKESENKWSSVSIELPAPFNIKGIGSMPMKPYLHYGVPCYNPHCSECAHYEACTNNLMFCKALSRRITARKRASCCQHFQSTTPQIKFSVVYDIYTQKLYLDKTNLEPNKTVQDCMKKIEETISDYFGTNKQE